MTGRSTTKAALKEEKERLAELFRQAPGAMAVLRGPDHVFELANEAFLQFSGHRELIGRSVREAKPELAGQGFFELLDQVYATGKPFVGREEPMKIQRRSDGPAEDVYVDFVYQPIRDESGAVTGIFIEGYDVTDRVKAAEHQQLLLHELNHRVKNTLATVQSIVSQTLRSAATPPEARAAIEQRMIALSRAHDVLTSQSWEGACLRDIVCKAIEPFHASGNHRFHVTGPDIRLSPRTALDLAMALHELGTNAVKYGALSDGAGEIDLTWSIDEALVPSRLTLRWEERGGPPVEPPRTRGFGSRLIERSLAQALGGEVRIDFPRTGVVCTIEAPTT